MDGWVDGGYARLQGGAVIGAFLFGSILVGGFVVIILAVSPLFGAKWPVPDG